MSDREQVEVFFNNLEDNLSKAEIGFKAYERGYADAKKISEKGLKN